MEFWGQVGCDGSPDRDFKYFEGLLKFDGMYNPKYLCDFEDFLDWVLDMDDCFENMNIWEKEKIDLALSKLEGCVAVWWYLLQLTKKRRGKNSIISWPNLMMKEYLLVNYKEILEERYRNPCGLSNKDHSLEESIYLACNRKI